LDSTSKPARRGRQSRIASRESDTEQSQPPVWGGLSAGRFSPLSPDDIALVHESVLSLLENTGISLPIPSMVERVVARGGSLCPEGRLRFPRVLVEDIIAGARRDIVLYGREAGQELDVSGSRVYFGSGGASPSIVDLDTGEYRPSTTRDLYDAARLVDALSNVHLFSRSMVATDAPDPRSLDINTAYACLAGTSKHVCISISDPAHVSDIARICYDLAGSEALFRAEPFMTIMVCHVVPPMRFAEEACATIEQAVLAGFPVQLISAGQAGATSPATIAGSLAQAVAETLAGFVFARLVDGNARAIFAPKPLVADLRTGSMSGGGGEQAILMAAAAQMGRYYDLATSSIAGITDAKTADAQHGFEKNLAVSLAAHAGSNIVTQACGMQASLLGCSLEGYVIDNDMLGNIMRSIRGAEVSEETLAVEIIDQVSRNEGHYLGHPQTLARMESDYYYPEVSDRRTPAEWSEDGMQDMRQRALVRTRQILAEHFPDNINSKTDRKLRHEFEILLPPSAMSPAPAN